MLVSKFLAKNKLELPRAPSSQGKELEMKLHALVIREFEKFVKN